MPLFKKSKKPADMKSDMEGADKSPKKDMGIAFEIQRKNKKKKMMAEGGPVSAKDEPRPSTESLDNDSKMAKQQNSPKPLPPGFDSEPRAKASHTPSPEALDAMRQYLAKGGFVTDWIDGYSRSADDQDTGMDLDMTGDAPLSHEDEISANDEDERPGSIVAAIMGKRKKFAEGGMVDLEDNAIEHENTLDDLNFNALGKENYSEKAGLDSLDYDTDESIGDDIEKDKHDMVSSILSKMRSKR